MNSCKKEVGDSCGADVSVPEDIDVQVSEYMLIGWTVADCGVV
jgi:hypothetical protein